MPPIKHRHFALLAIGLLVATLISSTIIQTASAANAHSFNPSNIIDDTVFTNKDSMSVSQIQAFLNSKVTCDTMGLKTSELGGGTRAQWLAANGISVPITCINGYYENPATGANNYGKSSIPSGAISAAQIIYNYSFQFNINPQVIIVTLQKENGLITDEWPTPRQYTQAMGFGCPDNVAPGAPACDPTYKSFSTQIYQAARHFRGYIDRDYCDANWCTPKTTGNNTILWNPSSSCGSSVVNIQNRATVALYSYTPYRPNPNALIAGYGTGDSCSSYGNRNFYLYFTDWFGSTYAPDFSAQSVWQQVYTDNTKTTALGWNANLVAGQSAYAVVAMKNTGNMTWTNSGAFGVTDTRLATSAPWGRQSAFCDPTWIISCTRPATLKEASVAPGQYGTFEFAIKAPSQPGSYAESFAPIVDGRTVFSNGGMGIGLNVK